MFVTSSTKDNVVLVSFHLTYVILNHVLSRAQVLVILRAIMITITITHAENMHATAKCGVYQHPT